MRIAHFLFGRCNPESANGVEKSVYNLTKHLALLNNDVALFSLTTKEPVPIPGVEVRAYPPRRIPFLLPGQLLDDLRAWKPDVVHLHSVYSPWNASMAGWLVRQRIPYVVTPHGGLSPFVLQRNRLKKHTYRILFELPLLNRASFIHAIADKEDIRAYGVTSPIVEISNGIDVDEIVRAVDVSAELEPVVEKGKKAFIFLGRLDPDHKGLDLLIEGFSRLEPDRAVLLLIGPDFRGKKAFLEAMAKDLGVSSSVIFAGPRYGIEKYRILATADVFVHPSRWEAGVPFSVMEAAACGLPCLVTPAADPRALFSTHKAGILVQTNVEAIAYGLETMLNLELEELREMGSCARKLVASTFSWFSISQQLHDAYYERI